MATCIAVINDDTTFLHLMHDLLTEEGYDTHLFHEGAADYPAVKEVQPAAIILDIRLEQPAAGWQTLELFKLDPTLTHTPVIICSADLRSLQEHAVHLRSKGCEILAKPFDLDDLLTLLHRLVGEPR